MNNIFEGLVLRNYGGIVLKPAIDEKIEDVKLAIKYNDHGDDFLLIKTENETYKYGWWLNRPGYPSYDDLNEIHNYFIRKPTLYFAYDNNSRLSNEICRYIDWHFTTRSDFGDEIMKCSDHVAQCEIDSFIHYMNNDIATRGITYDWTNACSKNKILRFMDINGIMTDENVNAFNNIKWSSKIDGADGISGKMKYYGDRLYGDSISFIYYLGKYRDPNKIKMKHQLDDWCEEVFDLSLKQFK